MRLFPRNENHSQFYQNDKLVLMYLDRSKSECASAVNTMLSLISHVVQYTGWFVNFNSKQLANSIAGGPWQIEIYLARSHKLAFVVVCTHLYRLR